MATSKPRVRAYVDHDTYAKLQFATTRPHVSISDTVNNALKVFLSDEYTVYLYFSQHEIRGYITLNGRCTFIGLHHETKCLHIFYRWIFHPNRNLAIVWVSCCSQAERSRP